MKTILIALVAGLIIMTQFSDVYAGGYYQTGNDLLDAWRVRQRTEQNPRVSTDLIEETFLVGYITGIADVVLNMPIPPTVSRGQLADIVGKYLESHPEERHEAAAVVVVRALGRVFPLWK